MNEDLCTVCGLPIAVGEWPCVYRVRPHGTSVQTDVFSTYFDVGLGREVTSLGDRWAAMRGTMDPESGTVRGQLDYREHPSRGELSARRDRAEAERKERARG